MDTLAGQPGTRQNFLAESRQHNEGVDFCLVRSKPAMNHIHARYCRRPRERPAVTPMPQAWPWKMPDAFLAGLLVPEKQRIGARQPVVVQRLHHGHARSVGGPENTRAQQRKRVVHVNDIRRKTRDRFFHHGIAAERPHGLKSRGKETDGADAIQLLCPGKDLLYLVTVAAQEIRLEGHDRLFPAPAGTVLVVYLKYAQLFRRLRSQGRLTGKRLRPSPSVFRETC